MPLPQEHSDFRKSDAGAACFDTDVANQQHLG